MLVLRFIYKHVKIILWVWIFVQKKEKKLRMKNCKFISNINIGEISIIRRNTIISWKSVDLHPIQNTSERINIILHTSGSIGTETFSRGLITFQRKEIWDVELLNGSIGKLLICVKCCGTFCTRPVESQCNSNPGI